MSEKRTKASAQPGIEPLRSEAMYEARQPRKEALNVAAALQEGRSDGGCPSDRQEAFIHRPPE